jgi:hypothetical protein
VKNLIAFACVATIVCVPKTAQAGVMFFDLDGGQQAAWDLALTNGGHILISATAWGGLADFGVTGIDGPVDSTTNNAIFSPGDIPADLSIDSNLNSHGVGGPAGRGPGGAGLAGIGPASVFAPASNALIANDDGDSFDIISNDPTHSAMEVNPLHLGDMVSTKVDITVYDNGGVLIGQLLAAEANGAAGRRWGILATDGDKIGRVNIEAVGPNEFGGVMGVKTYGGVQGSIMFFDLDGGDQAAWDAALTGGGHFLIGGTDWAALADFGLTEFDGPVDAATDNGTFSPGDIPDDLAFDSNLNPNGVGGPAGRGPGGMGLVGIGPGSAFSPSANTLMSNNDTDTFDVFSLDPGHTAMELTPIHEQLLGGGMSVDITVFDNNGNMVGQLLGADVDGEVGRRWGILAVDGATIGRVNVDAGGGFLEFGGVRAVSTYNDVAPPMDTDADGVPDADDVCPNNTPGLIVDGEGRPKGDMNDDCNVDGTDVQFFVMQLLNQ